LRFLGFNLLICFQYCVLQTN